MPIMHAAFVEPFRNNAGSYSKFFLYFRSSSFSFSLPSTSKGKFCYEVSANVASRKTVFQGGLGLPLGGPGELSTLEEG